MTPTVRGSWVTVSEREHARPEQGARRDHTGGADSRFASPANPDPKKTRRRFRSISLSPTGGEGQGGGEAQRPSAPSRQPSPWKGEGGRRTAAPSAADRGPEAG